MGKGTQCRRIIFYDASKKDCSESLTYAKWETGWDGSVCWNNGFSNYWAIDLNCYMVMSYSAMKYLAKELGKQSESDLWELKEKALSTLINEKM